MGFEEFFTDLGSVEQDHIRDLLVDMSSAGKRTRIDSLEGKLRSIHHEINKINSIREGLSGRLLSAESASKIVDQRVSDSKNTPIWLLLLQELLHSYIIELKQSVEDTKPNEQLKDKYLMREQIKSMQTRSVIADSILSEISVK